MTRPLASTHSNQFNSFPCYVWLGALLFWRLVAATLDIAAIIYWICVARSSQRDAHLDSNLWDGIQGIYHHVSLCGTSARPLPSPP